MHESAPASNGFAMAVLVEGGLVLVAMVLAWIFSVPLREQFPTSTEQLGWAVARGLAVTLPMLAMFWWLSHSNWPTLRQLREQVEWLIGQMFPNAGAAQFALIAILAGVGEELLFRGVLQYKLIEWTNAPVGLIVASLIFGAAHSLSKLYFLLATLIGVCFGFLALYYNDLVAPIVAHAVYDFVALVCLARTRRLRLSANTAPPTEAP